MMTILLMASLLSFFNLYCETPGHAQTASSQSSTQEPSGEISASKLGTAKNVHQLGNLYFSGQFAKGDINALVAQKIERVITLRSDGEIDWDEKAVVEAADIEFFNIPFRSPEALTDEVFDEIRALLKDESKTTLFHCGSANRVGGVWLPYRVLDQGVPLETALTEAAEIGLQTAFIKEKAMDYIKRNQAAPKMGEEESVKPGINRSFINPNLDVDTFIKRFEIESREVFLGREKILAACEIEKGDTIADVGAGTGLFTRLFSVEVGDQGWVYAVDIAPRFIEHINKDAAKHQLTNITGVLCAENSINLPSNSVDVVFICDTYHHFEYPKSTLASIRRSLKDDGHLIVIDFERIKGQSRAWLMDHVRAGKDVFQNEILESGFTLDEEKKIDGFQENYFLKFRKN